MRELDGFHALILKAARGDPCAEFDIYTLAQEPLYQFITRKFRVIPEEDAQEILKQALFTIYAHAREYRGQNGDASARSWAYAIAYNQARKWLRTYKKIVPFIDSDIGDETGAEMDVTLEAIHCNPSLDTDTVEDEALERILLQRLIEAARKLNLRERYLLHLRCVEGLNYRQIADRLKVSAPRIRQMMQAIQGKCRGAVGWDGP